MIGEDKVIRFIGCKNIKDVVGDSTPSLCNGKNSENLKIICNR